MTGMAQNLEDFVLMCMLTNPNIAECCHINFIRRIPQIALCSTYACFWNRRNAIMVYQYQKRMLYQTFKVIFTLGLS